jgi:hypothetical protein
VDNIAVPRFHAHVWECISMYGFAREPGNQSEIVATSAVIG